MSNSNLFNKHGFLIRRRSVREIFDLACLLLRVVGLRGIGYSLVLGFPVFLINFLILPHEIMYSPLSDSGLNTGYLMFFTIVTLLEGDFVFSPMILFLGEWFFHPDEKISPKKIFRQWRRLLPQILFYLVFFRFPFVFNRQIVNILLLEKTPFRKNKWQISTGQRANYFRKASSRSTGDNLAPSAVWAEFFFIIFMVLTGFFLLNFWGHLFFGDATLISVLSLLILFPLYCWSIAFFISIYKFLTYLHLRIAQEGWDLEIAFKAELLRHQEKIGELAPISQKDLYESFSSSQSLRSLSEESQNSALKNPQSDSPTDLPSAPKIPNSSPEQFSANEPLSDESDPEKQPRFFSLSSASGQELHS